MATIEITRYLPFSPSQEDLSPSEEHAVSLRSKNVDCQAHKIVIPLHFQRLIRNFKNISVHGMSATVSNKKIYTDGYIRQIEFSLNYATN